MIGINGGAEGRYSSACGGDLGCGVSSSMMKTGLFGGEGFSSDDGGIICLSKSVNLFFSNNFILSSRIPIFTSKSLIRTSCEAIVCFAICQILWCEIKISKILLKNNYNF